MRGRGSDRGTRRAQAGLRRGLRGFEAGRREFRGSGGMCLEGPGRKETGKKELEGALESEGEGD